MRSSTAQAHTRAVSSEPRPSGEVPVESIVPLSGFLQYLRNFYSKIAFPLVTIEQAQRPFDHGFVLSPGEGHTAILMHFMGIRTWENDREFDYESTNGRTVTRLAPAGGAGLPLTSSSSEVRK